jgi:hypothetical protein
MTSAEHPNDRLLCAMGIPRPKLAKGAKESIQSSRTAMRPPKRPGGRQLQRGRQIVSQAFNNQ